MINSTRIRAITVGLDINQSSPYDLGSQLNYFYQMAEADYLAANYSVQTRRLTIPPMPINTLSSAYQIKSTIETLLRISNEINIRWLCLPLKSDTETPSESLKVIIHLLQQHQKVFAHFIIAENRNIYNLFCNSAAKTILSMSRLSSNGYDNFRIGVGANIKPNTPYFPFSYHGNDTGFSLAVELIQLIRNSILENKERSLSDLRNHLIQLLTSVVLEIDAIGKNLEYKSGLQYKGQDISIAPFPDNTRSVASLIELLHQTQMGQLGTVFATSILTDILKTIIKNTGIRSTGFNGVMFSLLEDCELAKANDKKHLSIEKLMLYSTVCGCGIDMVPVPGDIFEEELKSLILDVAALSSILNKPLGVRVLPIPMKSANEFTNFNHDFLTNTRIMKVDGQYHSPQALSSQTMFEYLRFKDLQ